MIATTLSSTLFGIEGRSVGVQVHVVPGLPSFTLIGLPDAACREARDRVRAALSSVGVSWATRRVTVNLEPSTMRKVGSGLDLAIAVGLLVAAEKIKAEAIVDMSFIGELALDGSIRPVPGIVSLVDAVTTGAVVVAEESTSHAALAGRCRVYGAQSLQQLIEAVNGSGMWSGVPLQRPAQVPDSYLDLSDVRGQPLARWALEVAAAGGHNLMMTGPPGAGKTMLARRLPTLLPDLDGDVALVTTRVHSATGLLRESEGLITRPPFRGPHHTVSKVALVGGGSGLIRPGEVSLANGGVLFLDELTEFAPGTLDALREPLEEGVVRITRAIGSAELPAQFLCVAAMNPCPCGEGMTPGVCRCPESVRERYAARISVPFLDRFDLRVIVQRPNVDQLLSSEPGESSSTVAKRVAGARQLAVARGVPYNAALRGKALHDATPLASDALALVKRELRRGGLTARGLDRVRRVALTLADLDGGRPVLQAQHVSAALQLRPDLYRLEQAS